MKETPTQTRPGSEAISNFIYSRRHFFRIAICVLSGLLLWTILINLDSLSEGSEYLKDGIRYRAVAEHPVAKDGPYGIIYELIALDSRARMERLCTFLDRRTIPYLRLPIRNGFDNLWIPGQGRRPVTILSAHYDKLHESGFEGANDNTSSLAVLLRLLDETGAAGRKAGVLFTGLEETGLEGAYAFIQYMRSAQLDVHGVLVLDMVGRGALSLMRSAQQGGFLFRVPLLGDIIFDGSEFSRASQRWPLNLTLIDPNRYALRQHRAFLGYTDATAFLEHGIPAVHLISNDMWFAEQTWNSFADTIEKIDERGLDDAYETLLRFVRDLP